MACLVFRLVHKQLEPLVPLGVEVIVDDLAARHSRRAHSQPATKVDLSIKILAASNSTGLNNTEQSA